MTIEKALRLSALEHIDAEVLMASIFGKDRAWIVSHREHTLTTAQEQQWQEMEQRRTAGEPVAYIVGEKEFYGRPFAVNPHVLIPRPATESLIDLALEFIELPHEDVRPLDHKIVGVAKPLMEAPITTIVDVGTGSGCIAITLAIELPSIRIVATDISEDALAVAKKNAERYGVSDRITFLHGNGLEPLMSFGEPFLLVSNPPYIPAQTHLMKDVTDYEPHTALFAGEDGTDVLRQLIRQAADHPSCTGFVVECREEQATVIQDF